MIDLLGMSGGRAEGVDALDSQAVRRLSSVHVPFMSNEGQIASDDVRFYARTFAGTFFVTDATLPVRRCLL